MPHFNKNWIAAGFLGLGTLSFGVVVLLMGVLVSQRQPITESESRAATPACTVTFTIRIPTATPTSSISPSGTPIPTATPTPSSAPSITGTPPLTPTPEPVGQCVNIKLYRVSESSWTHITDLATIVPGDAIVIAVAGASSGGIIDEARFLINDGAWIQTTQVNQFGEYYIHYTIPETTTGLVIQAQVHHSVLGWL